MVLKRFFYLIILLMAPAFLMAQTETASVSASASVSDIAFDSAFSKINKRKLAIYNGKEYYTYFIKQGGKYGLMTTTGAYRPGEHPFFMSDEFRSESIEFDGVVYKSIYLSYDICRSEVVVLTPKRKGIILPEGKVQRFNYDGHSFRTLNTVNNLDPDFYDILFWTDSTGLVSKRRKNQTELWHMISDYYVILNNRAYPVSLVSVKSVGVKATLLEILKDEKDAMRSYIRQNRLKFSKKKKEASLIKAVEYYATLKNRKS